MLLRLLQRLSDVGPAATPHGFRSSFREWAAEATNFPREAAELALAHSVGDSVERAYQRGDLLEKRRNLMEAWAAYCGREPNTAEVIPIMRRNRIEPRGDGPKARLSNRVAARLPWRRKESAADGRRERRSP